MTNNTNLAIVSAFIGACGLRYCIRSPANASISSRATLGNVARSAASGWSSNPIPSLNTTMNNAFFCSKLRSLRIAVPSIPPCQPLPPLNLGLGVYIAPKPVQPFLHGHRMYLMKRRTEIVDPGNERERKLLMPNRTTFEFGWIDAFSGHLRCRTESILSTGCSWGGRKETGGGPRRREMRSSHNAVDARIL